MGPVGGVADATKTAPNRIEQGAGQVITREQLDRLQLSISLDYLDPANPSQPDPARPGIVTHVTFAGMNIAGKSKITAGELANILRNGARNKNAIVTIWLENPGSRTGEAVKVSFDPRNPSKEAMSQITGFNWSSILNEDTTALVTVGKGSPDEASQGTGAPAGKPLPEYNNPIGDLIYSASLTIQELRTSPFARQTYNNNPWLRGNGSGQQCSNLDGIY